MDLLEKVLNYAKGVPLALKVLGLLLHGRTNEEWESALEKLKKHPSGEIFGALKLSYDGLDDEQKDIFLETSRGRMLYNVYSLTWAKSKEVELYAQTFKMMHNMRLLQFYKSNRNQESEVYIPSFLDSLLRFL